MGLSTVTVLRQKGVLFSTGQNSSANAHAEPAKKRATEPQPKKKVEPATGKTQNSPVLQAKPEASVAPASEKKASEPQPEQPKQAAETKQSTANTTAPAAKQTQTAQADNKKLAEKTTDTNAAKKTGDTFAYTASAGSSYTLFAREAVSSVVANQQLQASTTQTLQAEVELTNNAGSPLLDIGQAVTISRTDVIAALQHAGVKIDAQKTQDSHGSNAQAAAASADYSAAANPGDSYTLHARAAIAKYLQANKQALSPEQRAAAESYIVSAAGAPSLEVGQTVVINSKTIADAVARASSLSTSEQAAWSQWATP
ncbi:MAG: hypothetical protein ACFNNB_00325 [Candidatus Saccharimonas sp.]